MNFWMTSFLLFGLAALLLGAGAFWMLLRSRNMHLWLGSYYFGNRESARTLDENAPLHVFIAVCDHYEPEWSRPAFEVSLAKVDRWVRDYPRLFDQFQDSRGQKPQHTFFYPQDEYKPEYLDRLAKLCRQGYGDVDIHLHHDNDTAESLRAKLNDFKQELHLRHGLLRTDPVTDEIIYGFIHGNWALCNSRPDGRWCGVNDELTVLKETGCYADFTLPSAPSNTQTQTINSIYYAHDCPHQSKSHDHGTPAEVGKPSPEDQLLLIQGPLLPDFSDRKYGILPRIENGDIHATNVPTWRRFKNWLKAGVHVTGRPDWLFVKLHTHGCKDGNIDMLLGAPMVNFHRQLADQARRHPQLKYYYVTAWEMAQLVHQAEQGATVPDFSLTSPSPLASTN